MRMCRLNFFLVATSIGLLVLPAALVGCGADTATTSAATTAATQATTSAETTAATQGTTTSGKPAVKYRVGLSDPAGSQEIDQAVGHAAAAAAETLGIEFTILDANLDINKQLQDINQFIAQKMDAILVFPLAPDSLNPALAKAREAGIKVIGMSAVVTDKQPTGDFGPYDALYEQNSAIGGAHLLAEFLNKEVASGGNVLGVGIGFPVPSLKLMLDNYKKGVTAPNGTLQWLATVDNPTDDIAGAQTVTQQAITRFQGQKIDAVMAYNTSSAVGAANALRSASSSGAVVVGQNGDKLGVEALQDGRLTAMVDIMPWRSGLALLNLTLAVLEGKPYPLLTFGRPKLYTKDTLSQRVDWDQAVEDIKSGKLTFANSGAPTGTDAEKPY